MNQLKCDECAWFIKPTFYCKHCNANVCDDHKNRSHNKQQTCSYCRKLICATAYKHGYPEEYATFCNKCAPKEIIKNLLGTVKELTNKVEALEAKQI